MTIENQDPMSAVVREVQLALAKFPTWPTDPFHAYGVLSEEHGELAKALVQHTYEPHKGVTLADIRMEAIQTAAMAIRFLASLDHYDFREGHQHQQPMLLAPERIAQ